MSATQLAHLILRQIIEAGVTHFVVSPGSRNAPLLIALNEAAQRQIINLHVKIDERGAAFFALGIAKASQTYVAVICTSGTAAANFHPAALEALHSNSKLLIITADRPARLRKTGANQTTDQVGIFSPIKTLDIVSAEDFKLMLGPGPIHLNVQFDEPLIEHTNIDWLTELKIIPKINESRVKGELNTTTGVLIIGHDRGGYSVSEITQFAKKLNWPIVAEDPLSFPEATAHSALFFTDPQICLALKPENVIVIGRTTLSRSTNSFIKLANYLIVIDPKTENIDIQREGNMILNNLPLDVISKPTDTLALKKISEITALELRQIKWSEQSAVVSICRSLKNGTALFIGSSRPVRDIEAFCTPRTGVSVFANRGLAGIDGNISTVLGISQQFENTVAILGDLTFLHDLSALVNAAKKNLRIFVIDNNGGGIFSTLPQAGVDNFDQIFGTPHNLDLQKITESFDIKVVSINDLQLLEDYLATPIIGLEVAILNMPSREENAKNLKEVTQRVLMAVRMGINLA